MVRFYVFSVQLHLTMMIVVVGVNMIVATGADTTKNQEKP
jgi:hypothetical protein